ncbi:MAG: HDOD domain-containing protein [Chitinivibrionales bacterium]|nr:HDOD domain-containing protein [Chitinivibrionales bacterium]MBD3394516.1 HDOD domain-containing protein [Chitinivibrionales bacterium]
MLTRGLARRRQECARGQVRGRSRQPDHAQDFRCRVRIPDKRRQLGIHVNQKRDLLEAVRGISTIPTIPTVLEKITLLLQNPQTSAEEIGRAITTDQSLASKVLKLVNSAFYGFPGKISTITHAVVILGFSTIKNIVLTASIFDVFRKKGHRYAGFDMEKFWFHSIACGAASQSVAKFIGSSEREEAFIAGLIHDVGKIIECQYLEKEFTQIVRETQQKNQLFFDSEKQLFEVTHQEIGGLLCQSWNLPENLQNAVKYHHNPSKSRSHYLTTAIVHCADILVRAMDLGNGGDNKIPRMSDQVWQSLGLENLSLQSLLENVNDEVEKTTIFMQI